MGFLDSLKSAVRSSVSSATNFAEKAAGAVKAEATAVANAVSNAEKVVKDTFIPPEKNSKSAPAYKPPEKHFYDGITDAFAHTEQAIQHTVSSTVRSVETSVSSAGHAVLDAGHAVQHAGRQVIDSGEAIVKAGKHAIDDVEHVALDAGRAVSDAGHVALDAGKAAYHAGNAAITGNPKELDAAHAAITRARHEVNDAHAAVADAHARLADVGTQGEHVSTALHAATAALHHAGTRLEEAGSSVRDAISSIASAPRTVMSGVEKALADGGAEAKAAIIRDVPGAKQMLGGIEKYATGAKDVVVGLATSNPFALAQGIREEAGGVVDFGKGFVQTPAFDAAKKYVVDYANGFNVDKQIKSLKPGESYELKVGANVHVEVGGEANGTLKIAANKDGTYTVDAGGAAGVNGYLHAGGRVNLGPVNGSAGAEGSLHGLLGGNVELKCANAEEAAKAAGIFEKLAATNTATLVMNQGQVLTKDEARFLKEHTTSVEVTGNVAAEVTAALGLDKGIIKAGIGGSVQLGVTQAVKIDLANGKPTGLSVRQEYEGEVEAHGGIGLQLPKGNAPARGAAPQLDAKGNEVENPLAEALDEMPKTVFQGKVTDTLVLETHYDFPKGVSLADFQKDPKGTIQKAAAEMNNSAEMKATLTAEGEGTLLGKSGNVASEISFSGKPSEVINPEAFARAMRGDYQGAARLMGDKITVEGKLNTYTQKKWGFEGLGGDVVGVGLEGTFQATRRHDNEPLVEYKQSATESVANVKANLAPVLKPRGIVSAK